MKRNEHERNAMRTKKWKTTPLMQAMTDDCNLVSWSIIIILGRLVLCQLHTRTQLQPIKEN